MGIVSTADGYGAPNPINGLEGQPSAITNGMSFTSSTQVNTTYIDSFIVSSGMAAFVESNYGTVAVQNTGSYGQRTFVFSYALAELVDGASSPSTKSDLLGAILDFFLEEPVLVNNPPQITSPDTATATVDELFVYRATATDPDGDPVTFTFDSLSTWLSVVGPDSVTGTPGEGVTEGRFRVIASDGQLYDTLVVTITVAPANDPPQITSSATATATEDELFGYHATATDPEGNTVAFGFDNLSDWLTIVGGDSVAGTPGEGVTGGSFRVIAWDDQLLYDSLTVTITVNPVNDPPQITSSATATATEDAPFIYYATADDPEDSVVTFTFEQLPDWLAAAGDSVFVTPAESILSDSFAVIATDGELYDSLTVTITVNPVNDAPIAVNDTVRTSEDKVVTLAALVNDRDPDGDEFYLADTTWLAHHGQVSIIIIDTVGLAGIIFIYIPNTNFFGSDSFSYSVADGVLFDTALVLITVTPVNDPPESFALLGPGSDDTTTVVITTENISNILTFSWESAEDVDGDSVWYCFDATGTLAAIFPSGDTSATELNLAYSDLVPLIREAGESGRVTGTWTIMATDGTSTTQAANGPFGLTLDISRLGVDGQDDIPKEFALRQNYPNPFNPSTTLRFALPRAVEVRLVVVDLLGREIARLVDGHLPTGYHQVTWDGETYGGKEAPSGVYIARLIATPTAGMAPGFVRQVKMVLLK